MESLETKAKLKTIETPYVIGDAVYSKEAAKEGFLVKGQISGIVFLEDTPTRFHVVWNEAVVNFGPQEESELLPEIVPALDLIIAHHEKTLKQFQDKREEALRRGNDEDDGGANQQVNEKGREKAD